MNRPDFIKNCEDLRTNESFSYPGDTETFGTGAALGRSLGLKRVAINYEVLEPGDRSSWPHAHKEEEEFIFILEGGLKFGLMVMSTTYFREIVWDYHQELVMPTR